MAHGLTIPPYIAARALEHLKRGGDPQECFSFPVALPKEIVARKPPNGRRVLRADPISIGIAIITAAEAISGIALGFEAASFVGSTLLLGGSLAASAFLSSASGAGALGNVKIALNSPEVRLNHRQATPAKRVIYGRALVGGDMFFERAVDPYLYHGWLVASHEIEGFEQVRIGSDIIAIFSAAAMLPANQILTPQGNLVDGLIKDEPDYAANLILSLRHGTAAQTIDPLLAADFTSLSGTFRQRGIATAVLRYKWPGVNYDDRQEMWGDVQAPNPLFLVKGRKVFDPRDPTQAQGSSATWKWSETAALVQADYLVQEYGGRIDPDDIDWDEVRDAADYDDELVGCKNGELIRRHTINGVVTLNQPPSEVIKGMLSANRGFICARGGTVWVSSSRPRSPVLTIHDGMLTAGIEFYGQKPKRDLVNRVRSRFIASEREYEEVDGPLLDRTDLQASDNEILSATADLPFTLDHRRAQRLQKQYLETSRLGKSLTVRVALTALAETEEEILSRPITFDSALFPFANGAYRVHNMGFSESFSSLELQMLEYSPDIETNWIPAQDERDFQISEPDLS